MNLFWLIEDERQVASPTVLTIKHVSHEHTSTALLTGALTTLAGDLAIVVHLVILKHSKLYFLVLVLDLLGCGVVLLLALLGTTTEAQHQVKGGFLLDVVVRQSAAILKLLASEDQTLLIRRNSFLILDLGFHIFDSIRGLYLKRYGFHEDLHGGSHAHPDLGEAKEAPC